jgi:hypothetical protein
VTVTGPGGWIHARPTATGEFVVLAPDELAPDAP